MCHIFNSQEPLRVGGTQIDIQSLPLILASISRLSPSKRTNCRGSKVTLQFVRVEGESLEIEATLIPHFHQLRIT